MRDGDSRAALSVDVEARRSRRRRSDSIVLAPHTIGRAEARACIARSATSSKRSALGAGAAPDLCFRNRDGVQASISRARSCAACRGENAATKRSCSTGGFDLRNVGTSESTPLPTNRCALIGAILHRARSSHVAQFQTISRRKHDRPTGRNRQQRGMLALRLSRWL